MSILKALVITACLVISVAIVPVARAQWAVVDVGAIAQLIQQLQTMGLVSGVRQLLDPCKGEICWRAGDAHRSP